MRVKPSGIFLFYCLDARKKYAKKASFLFTYNFNHKNLVRQIENTYNASNQILYVHERYSGITDTEHDFYEQKDKLWNSEQLTLAARKGGCASIQRDKKTNLSSQHQKKNQTLYFLKKE